MAAAGISDQDLSHVSKSALNAYAMDLEERLATAGIALEKAKYVAQDAIAMKALFDCNSEEAVHHLAICSLDAIARAGEGAMSIFCEHFIPLISEMNARHAPQQQQYSRQSFPAPPEMSQNPGQPIDINQIPPAMRWQYIDANLAG